MTSPANAERANNRDRRITLGAILVITGFAWAYLVHLRQGMSSAETMAQMGMVMNAPWTVRDVLFTFTMWSVMMIAMMNAAAAPVLLIFAGTRSARTQSNSRLPVFIFGLGYFTVWIGFSAIAALTQYALHQAALLSPNMTVLSTRIAGAILIGAGLYQLSPLKRTCLVHCQSPLGFLMMHWRNGNAGAYRMGLHHGIYCLGCCWALMAVLFAVGVMSLAWVALLAAFVLLEKIGPKGPIVSRIGGAIMIAAGLRFAFF